MRQCGVRAYIHAKRSTNEETFTLEKNSEWSVLLICVVKLPPNMIGLENRLIENF
jgi:hypothetical protein